MSNTMNSLNSSSSCSGDSTNSSSIKCSADSSNEPVIKTKKLSNDNVSNNSRELKANLSKGRVVPSKYKAVALEVAKKGRTDESAHNLSTGKLNSSDGKCSGKPSVRPKCRPLQRKGFAASAMNLTKVNDILPNKQFIKSNPRESQERQKQIDEAKTNLKRLHSTALNNTTFFDKTVCGSNDIFSTTVVDGPKQFLQQNQRNFPSLSELPDISTISPVNNNSAGSGIDNYNVLPTPFGENKFTKKEAICVPEEPCDYSDEEIQAEYLKYLTWALVNVDSEDKFKKQVTEFENQLLFLTSIVKEQQDALLEEQKALALVKHHEKISEDHLRMKNLFQSFSDSLEPCEKGLESLTLNLESQLNKIELKNIHIPVDQQSYTDELNLVLNENFKMLSQLNEVMKPDKCRDESLSSLINSINMCIDTANPCLSELDQLASLAIQESSLLCTLDTVKDMQIEKDTL